MSETISLQITDIMRHYEVFDNLASFKDFLKDEQTFWSQQANLGNSRNAQQNHIRDILQKLDILNDVSPTELQKNQVFNDMRQNFLPRLQSSWLWSGHSFIPALIEAYTLHEQTGQAFLQYLQTKQISNIQQYPYFKGCMLAYEFEMQGESTITKRRDAEKASYSTLRQRLDDTTNKLVAKVDDFQTQFSQWHDETKKTQIDEFTHDQATRKEEFSANQTERKSVFDETMSSFKTRITELENTYHEKLRLEKPAKYWHDKAKEYKINGNKWAKILAGILIGGFILFSVAFVCWLNAKNIGLELNSLQGAVIFATIVTIYALAIQATSKMVFSSYHLQRDAEEREQLAYVYLAITNEQKEIDTESRKIILQALFSRADTGLLKDSSPTMPGGLAELIKGIQK